MRVYAWKDCGREEESVRGLQERTEGKGEEVSVMIWNESASS